MDADTRSLLAGSIRAVLQSNPDTLMATLTELGWDDVVAEDEAAAVELLFTEQGSAGKASAALDGVVVAASGHDDRAPAVVVHPFGRLVSSDVAGRLVVDGVVLTEPARRHRIPRRTGPRGTVLRRDGR